MRPQTFTEKGTRSPVTPTPRILLKEITKGMEYNPLTRKFASISKKTKRVKYLTKCQFYRKI